MSRSLWLAAMFSLVAGLAHADALTIVSPDPYANLSINAPSVTIDILNDDTPITKPISCTLDGVLLSGTTDPNGTHHSYFSFRPSDFTPGQHRIHCSANLGALQASEEITLVNNGITNSNQVTIISPTSGANVSGTFCVSLGFPMGNPDTIAFALDYPEGMSGSGNSIPFSAYSPNTVCLNTDQYSSGSHTLYVGAHFASGWDFNQEPLNFNGRVLQVTSFSSQNDTASISFNSSVALTPNTASCRVAMYESGQRNPPVPSQTSYAQGPATPTGSQSFSYSTNLSALPSGLYALVCQAMPSGSNQYVETVPSNFQLTHANSTSSNGWAFVTPTPGGQVGNEITAKYWPPPPNSDNTWDPYSRPDAVYLTVDGPYPSGVGFCTMYSPYNDPTEKDCVDVYPNDPRITGPHVLWLNVVVGGAYHAVASVQINTGGGGPTGGDAHRMVISDPATNSTSGPITVNGSYTFNVQTNYTVTMLRCTISGLTPETVYPAVVSQNSPYMTLSGTINTSFMLPGSTGGLSCTDGTVTSNTLNVVSGNPAQPTNHSVIQIVGQLVNGALIYDTGWYDYVGFSAILNPMRNPNIVIFDVVWSLTDMNGVQSTLGRHRRAQTGTNITYTATPGTSVSADWWIARTLQSRYGTYKLTATARDVNGNVLGSDSVTFRWDANGNAVATSMSSLISQAKAKLAATFAKLASLSDSPSPTGTESPIPNPSVSATPTITASPVENPSALPSATESASPEPTASAYPSPTPTESASPEPSAEPSPSPTESASPEPSAEPSPSPTEGNDAMVWLPNDATTQTGGTISQDPSGTPAADAGEIIGSFVAVNDADATSIFPTTDADGLSGLSIHPLPVAGRLPGPAVHGKKPIAVAQIQRSKNVDVSIAWRPQATPSSMAMAAASGDSGERHIYRLSDAGDAWVQLPEVSLMDNWVGVLIRQSGTYAMMSGNAVDPAFQFGDVYAFPNPAKPGADPRVHVEAGYYDSIDVRMYNEVGELVKRFTIDTPPSMIKNRVAVETPLPIDGLATGEYFLSITAHKDGQHINRKEKFALIR